jgi:phosphopantothenoylcysteine decarboxylase/phosphopantothenate--cysteine ligase
LAEPEDILDRFIASLTPKDMVDLNVLVTAGPTHEAIDPVRYISNPSSGKMGYALARAAEHRGARVTLVAGPTPLPDPANVAVVRVRSAREMAEAVFAHMIASQVIIKAAAVGDYRPQTSADHKIKKTQPSMTLELIQNPDILKEVGHRKQTQFVVGFAAETRDLEQNAQTKLVAKNLDMIVGNLIGPPDSGFAADTNTATFFYADGTSESFAVMQKDAMAHALFDRVLTRIKDTKPAKPN